ncbi:hypothetical protein [Candidatus Brocadia sp. AMX2]|uniref:hypothetical protein n=1 Tax=Candidatus Brocadia sp. AMX2 TaxID=2293635 RepID=UPI0025531223|nr:hypothetical protein [Candidatus Brocadia sp. AMX2]
MLACLITGFADWLQKATVSTTPLPSTLHGSGFYYDGTSTHKKTLPFAGHATNQDAAPSTSPFNIIHFILPILLILSNKDYGNDQITQKAQIFYCN